MKCGKQNGREEKTVQYHRDNRKEIRSNFKIGHSEPGKVAEDEDPKITLSYRYTYIPAISV